MIGLSRLNLMALVAGLAVAGSLALTAQSATASTRGDRLCQSSSRADARDCCDRLVKDDTYNFQLLAGENCRSAGIVVCRRAGPNDQPSLTHAGGGAIKRCWVRIIIKKEYDSDKDQDGKGRQSEGQR